MRICFTRAIALIAVGAIALLSASEAFAKKRHHRSHGRHYDTRYRGRIYDDREWRPIYRRAPRVIYSEPVRPYYDRYYDDRWHERDGWRFNDEWRSAPSIRGSIIINP